MKSSMKKSKVDVFNDKGGYDEKEAEDTKDEFKSGGAAKKRGKKHAHGGAAKGEHPKGRLDRKPRASGGRSPYTSAASVSGGAEEDEGGKREVTGPGAETEIGIYKAGGAAKHKGMKHKKG